MMICVVVLPSFTGYRFCVFECNFSCRGEYTGRSTNITTLVLPSLNRFVFYVFRRGLCCRGEYTGEEEFCNSHSPLSEPVFVGVLFQINSDVGEITQGIFYSTLVLPSVILTPVKRGILRHHG